MEVVAGRPIRYTGRMLYSAGGGLIRKLLEKFLGSVSDGLTGGDPLDPEYNFVAQEKREKDPLYPLRVIEAELHKDVVRAVIGGWDEKLDKGIREGQREILNTQAGRVKDGGQFQLLCNVYHNGVPTALQVHLWGRGGGMITFHAEGRGPAAELLLMELRMHGVQCGQEESLAAQRDTVKRDGRFRRDQFGTEWRAHLPAEAGTLFGQPLEIVAEIGRPGLVGAGDVAATPLVRQVLAGLPALLGIAEAQLGASADDDDRVEDVACRPHVWLSAEVEDEMDWTLVVERTDWPDFGWHLEFHGLEFRELWAGD